MPKESTTEAIWRAILLGQYPGMRQGRHLLGLISAKSRCKNCNAPFDGWAAPLMRLVGRGPTAKNPRFCEFCPKFFRKHPGGAEVELSLLFVDVRGSTTLAEHMSAAEFSRLMNRFYDAATRALIKTDAFIDKLVGDEVIGLYFPGFAGPDYPRKAVQAAQELLHATGQDDPGGPWLAVGVGVHTGTAYVGTVSGAEGSVMDVTALGDVVNITARLASKAGPGEALISEATCAAAGLDLGNLEWRQLELKGKSELVGVRVMRVTAG